MTSALVPFTFNSIKLFTVTINGKDWCAKEICQSLNYAKKYPKCHSQTMLVQKIELINTN